MAVMVADAQYPTHRVPFPSGQKLNHGHLVSNEIKNALPAIAT
jgi:hypothetical protein